MKNDCIRWKDRLLEAALTGTAASGLEEHMLNCADCSAELAALRSRRERLEAVLPLVAQGAEPSVEFRARVLAAAEARGEAKRAGKWRVWQLAGAVGVVAVLVIGFVFYRSAVQRVSENELATAQKLAEWRAPSDVLLQTPGDEILRTTPKLGESYLRVLPKRDTEE